MPVTRKEVTMQARHSVRLLTAVLAFALLALLGSGTAFAVPDSDGGSGVSQSPCVPMQRLHLGHREQVDRDSAPKLCAADSAPTLWPSTTAQAQPAKTTTARGVLVAVLGFVALLASLVAGGAWRRLRATRPREAT
jgi:hypothetical protein